MQFDEHGTTANFFWKIQADDAATELRNHLVEEFQDEDARYAYADSFLNTRVAAQIKALREQRGLTQQALAEAVGTQQGGISRLENVNYSSWKTETLRKLARALGVRLHISFETFSDLLDDVETFERRSLERATFAEEMSKNKLIAQKRARSATHLWHRDQPATTGRMMGGETKHRTNVNPQVDVSSAAWLWDRGCDHGAEQSITRRN